MRISDWSSDVCSSDLGRSGRRRPTAAPRRPPARGEVAPGLVGAASAAGSSSLPCEGRGGLGRGAFGHRRKPWTPPPNLPLPSQGEGRSEEHTSELQSLMRNSYAVFCLKKKTTTRRTSKDVKSKPILEGTINNI